MLPFYIIYLLSANGIYLAVYTMKKPVTVSVKTPCHENWDAMSKVPNGRFCNACHTAVVDFSVMTDAQIHEYFRNAKGKVCGNFRQSQLERPLQPLYSTNAWGVGSRFKTWLLGLSLSVLGTGSGFSETKTKGQVRVFQQPRSDQKAFKVRLINASDGSVIADVTATAGNITRFSDPNGVADFYADTSTGARIILHLSATGFVPVVFVSEIAALDSFTQIMLDPVENETSQTDSNSIGKVAFHPYNTVDTVHNASIRVLSEHGDPLTGVTVSEPGAGELGFTDSSGCLHFALANKPDRVLKLEADGFKTTEYVLKQSGSDFTIVMKSEPASIHPREKMFRGDTVYRY